MQNECAVGDCSRRLDQPHKMPGCRVFTLSWVRTNHHGQLISWQHAWCCAVVSVWHIGCSQRQKQRRSERHPHRHNGLHRAGDVHGHRVQADVGRVWVGEQGRCQHQHFWPARISRPHYPVYEHEVSHTREGIITQWFTLSYHTHLLCFAWGENKIILLTGCYRCHLCQNSQCSGDDSFVCTQ